MENRLFEVKVMDSMGRVKKVIPANKLSERHWDIYNDRTRLYRKGSNLNYIFARPLPPGTPIDYDE